MAKGLKHLLRDGTTRNKPYHKKPNGKLHTGKTHSKSSKPLFHFGDLSDTAKKKARKK